MHLDNLGKAVTEIETKFLTHLCGDPVLMNEATNLYSQIFRKSSKSLRSTVTVSSF